MANKKTSEYLVVMRLREVVPTLDVTVTGQTHLMALRLAMSLNPAYIPERVSLDDQTWEVIGECLLCQCFILKGDRFAQATREVEERVSDEAGQITVRRRKIRGIECCECRPGARMIN